MLSRFYRQKNITPKVPCWVRAHRDLNPSPMRAQITVILLNYCNVLTTCSSPSRPKHGQQEDLINNHDKLLLLVYLVCTSSCAPHYYADGSVCHSGYSPSLSTTCTQCSRSRRQGVVAITIISAVVAFSAMEAFTKSLVSTNFEVRNATSIRHRILQVIPWKTIKGFIVVWQMLTQASVDGV